MNTSIKFDWDEFQKKITDTIGTSNLINYIFNEKNKMITEKYIISMLKLYAIDYKVNDIKIFQIAMTHTSYINKNWTNPKNFKMIFMGINLIGGDMLTPIKEENIKLAIQINNISYERLEFLGDAILRQIISDYLFIRYDTMQEGNLTKLRSLIENGPALASMTKHIGLNKYVLLSRNYEVIKARDKNEKIQCDIFEALIAAIYLDACEIKYDEIGIKYDLMEKHRGYGYQICYNFVKSLIEEHVILNDLLEVETNYKAELLEEFHILGWGDPKYNLMEQISDSKKMGKKYFKMYVRDPESNIIGTGIGTSKQKGEKIAAKKALQFLRVIANDDFDEIVPNNSSTINHKTNAEKIPIKLSNTNKIKFSK